MFSFIERRGWERKQVWWALGEFWSEARKNNFQFKQGFPTAPYLSFFKRSLIQVAVRVHAYERWTSHHHELFENKTLCELENCFSISLHSTLSIYSMLSASVWNIICKWLVPVDPFHLKYIQQGFPETAQARTCRKSMASEPKRIRYSLRGNDIIYHSLL